MRTSSGVRLRGFGTSQTITRLISALSSRCGVSWPQMMTGAKTLSFSISRPEVPFRFCLPSPSYTIPFRAWKLVSLISLLLYSSSTTDTSLNVPIMVDIAASVPVLRLKIGILGEMNSERMEIAICVLPDDIGPMKNGAVKSLSMQWILLLNAHMIAKTKAHLPLSLIL